MKFSPPKSWRLILLLALIASMWLVGWATGLHEHVTVEQIRTSIVDAGVWGAVLFTALFCVGQIAQVSGHPFIAAAVFVWGWWQGALVSIVAATLGAVASFALARTVGGTADRTERPFLQRLLQHLDDRPILTIALARAILMTAPPLAPALAVSGIRHRDHAVATFIGLVPSVLISAFAWEVGLDWFGVTR